MQLLRTALVLLTLDVAFSCPVAGFGGDGLPSHTNEPAKNPSAMAPLTVPFKQLTDLTTRAALTVTLVNRDSFTNEFRYNVSVRNQGSEPFAATRLSSCWIR